MARLAYAKSSVWALSTSATTVGPAAVSARALGLGIADALREGIAEGDIPAPGMLRCHLTTEAQSSARSVV